MADEKQPNTFSEVSQLVETRRKPENVSVTLRLEKEVWDAFLNVLGVLYPEEDSSFRNVVVTACLKKYVDDYFAAGGKLDKPAPRKPPKK